MNSEENNRNRPNYQFQLRAAQDRDAFKKNARKPLVIEFAGTPKAGKTTTINQIATFLKRCGYRVEIAVERASVCPIRDKRHPSFNVWTACTGLAQILEMTQENPHPDDPDIVILDRGLFDSICWLRMMERLARVKKTDRELIEKFLKLEIWRKRITTVILMTSSPKDALDRENGFLPVEKEGSIMNPKILKQLGETIDDCERDLGDLFRIHKINTSNLKRRKNWETTVKDIADIILDLISEHVMEEIFYVEKKALEVIFGTETTILRSETKELLNLFEKRGEFKPRKDVEADPDLVQALPAVVVRTKNGDVLRLRRREKSKSNSLDKELVIWAGGHVRKEDSKNGNTITQCATRELQEELRLSVEAHELRILGAIYVDTGGSTSKHVAIVYEWRARTDDVVVTLSKTEFFERRGTSLSGKFVPLNDLLDEVKNKKLSEPWSIEIVEKLLPVSSENKLQGLF